MTRTKICTKCRVEQSLEDFHKSKAHKDGLEYRCKACRGNDSKKWTVNNPEKVKAKNNKKKKPYTRAGLRKCTRCKTLWNRPKGDTSHTCPECQSRCPRCNIKLTAENVSQATIKRKRYTCKKCHNEMAALTKGNKGFKQRDSDLLRKYGITINEYEAILEAQGGVCYICKKPPTNRRLSVDHKHEPGEKKRDPREKRRRVRGLLCWRCNSAIGKFDDSPTFLRNAAGYLENPPAQLILHPGEAREMDAKTNQETTIPEKVLSS